MKRWRATVFCITTLAASCGKNIHVDLPPPTPARVGVVETGVASWYGKPYHGRRTSNGEVYDMHGLTAAHLSLPFDTRVRVTNLDNGRSVELRINDRGPFLKHRVIDVSRRAAERLDMMAAGTARVRVEVVGAPGTLPPPVRDVVYEPQSDCGDALAAVQVGSFRDAGNAARALAKLAGRYGDARIVVAETAAGALHRVVVTAPDSAAAGRKLAELERDGIEGFVMQMEPDGACLATNAS